MPPSDKQTRREFLATTSSAALRSAGPLPAASVPLTPEPASAATLGPYSAQQLLTPRPIALFKEIDHPDRHAHRWDRSTGAIFGSQCMKANFPPKDWCWPSKHKHAPTNGKLRPARTSLRT